MKAAERIIELVKVESLPEAAARLLDLCRDPDVGAGEIVRIIELDPALSARLLKVANSSYFGQRGLISTLTRAAVVLGNEYVKAVALGFFISSAWGHLGTDRFSIHDFWHDSVLRACLARELVKATGRRSTEVAFLLGMLQDIGSLILATHFKDDYPKVPVEIGRSGSERSAVERAAFGTDRAEIAGLLAQRWGFPVTLQVALGKQLTQPPFMRTVDHATVFWQIAYFCGAVPFANDRQTVKVDVTLRHLAIGAFGLSFEALGDVFAATVDHFNALRNVFFDIMSDQGDAAEIMREAADLIGQLDTGAIEKNVLR